MHPDSTARVAMDATRGATLVIGDGAPLPLGRHEQYAMRRALAEWGTALDGMLPDELPEDVEQNGRERAMVAGALAQIEQGGTVALPAGWDLDVMLRDLAREAITDREWEIALGCVGLLRQGEQATS